MYVDNEIAEMNRVYEALKDLDNGRRKRIIDWVISRYNLKDGDQFAVSPKQTTPARQEISPKKITPEKTPTPAPTPSPTPIPTAKKRNTTPKEEKISRKNMGLKPDGTRKTFSDYDTAGELFDVIRPKKGPDKILLMAGYLQIKMQIDCFTQSEIHTRLKNIGYAMTNIFVPMRTFMKRTPPYMAFTEKKGKNKGKDLLLTPEGLEAAKELLK